MRTFLLYCLVVVSQILGNFEIKYIAIDLLRSKIVVYIHCTNVCKYAGEIIHIAGGAPMFFEIQFSCAFCKKRSIKQKEYIYNIV